jgi:hypothetical protein
LLNVIKATYDKTRATITINGEQLKPFPLKSVTRQGFLLSPLLFKMILEFLVREIREEQDKTGIQIGKEEVKLSFL